MKGGKFNTDAKALINRIEAHDKYGKHDLNEWIFKHLPLKKGIRILDLGCGTGKQAIPLAQIIGKSGEIICLDISRKALDQLLKKAKSLKIANISVIRCNLDEIDLRLKKEQFDIILASFSLYYLKDPRRFFIWAKKNLKTNGTIFFCGPSKGNNLELKKFYYKLKGDHVPAAKDASEFMEDIGPKLAREFFRKIELSRFKNPLRFDCADSLYAYWNSYNLYDEKVDAKFRDAAKEFFQTRPVFETVKRVIGVKITNARFK